MTCQHVTGLCPGETCPCRPKTPCVDCGTWPAVNRDPSRCNACQDARAQATAFLRLFVSDVQIARATGDPKYWETAYEWLALRLMAEESD